MENDFRTAAALLRQGLAPGNADILGRITTETGSLADFIGDRYLSEYIALGGSKIKFVTGKPGSGKTHFLQLISLAAERQGFVSVRFSAKDVWLHDFKNIYTEVFNQADLTACLTKCAAKIAAELGYDSADIPDGLTFVDHLSSLGELDALIKKEIRNQLRQMFLKNPLIDNNFAIACSLLTGGILGHPVLEGANRSVLMSWLSGGKDVKLTELRGLGLSPAKITKFNARHMLRSLAETNRIAGMPGIVVTIDDVDILINASSLDTVRYTKLKREDAYESMRELIDEIDTLRNVMFFYAFDRRLIDNEISGLKSYQALWLRVQNEILSGRFNSFTDIIDLDRFGAERFGSGSLVSMSEKVAGVVKGNAVGLDHSMADEILANAQFSKISVPRQVVMAAVGSEGNGYGRF